MLSCTFSFFYVTFTGLVVGTGLLLGIWRTQHIDVYMVCWPAVPHRQLGGNGPDHQQLHTKNSCSTKKENEIKAGMKMSEQIIECVFNVYVHLIRLNVYVHFLTSASVVRQNGLKQNSKARCFISRQVYSFLFISVII